MTREHAGTVRLHRGDLSGKWFVVKIAPDGRTISDKWVLHPDDATALEQLRGTESE